MLDTKGLKLTIIIIKNLFTCLWLHRLIDRIHFVLSVIFKIFRDHIYRGSKIIITIILLSKILVSFWIILAINWVASPESRDERKCLFNPTPSRYQWFIPISIPRLSQVLFLFPSQSHQLFPFTPAVIPILVSHRTCCCFSCASWNKLPVNSKRMETFWHENNWKSSWKYKYEMSKMVKFSLTSPRLSLLSVGKGECSVSILSIFMLFPISTKLL